MQQRMRMAAMATVMTMAIIAVAAVAPAAAHLHKNPLSNIHVAAVKTQLGTGTITIDAPLIGVGSTVNVSWSGLTGTGNQDWIGVYSPKPASYAATAPAKYKFATSDSSGSGSMELWFVNMRASYTVVYFTGGLQAPVAIAESAPVDFDNYHLPLHLHLALTGDPTQMRVDWNSQQNAFPSLNWGDRPTNLNNSILRVRTSTYQVTDMCGPPASTVGWNQPGFLHSALIEGLEPNRLYYYQVGDESSHSKSEVIPFWSAPAPSPVTDLDFVIFGDLGQIEPDGSSESSQMDGSILTTLAMAEDFADGTVAAQRGGAVFHIGDISYAMGYGTVWEQFFYQIGTMSPSVAWMTVDGNHERDYPNSGSYYTGFDSGGECGVAYASRFHMPTSGAKDETWWSVTYGPVHMAVISTEQNFTVGSAQYQWLQADLAKVDRSQTPFLLLSGHRPMMIDSTYDAPAGGDLPVAAELRAALEPLLQKYRVDVAFWGHHHSYQRTCPVHNMSCTADPAQGTVHIVTGAAGPNFSTNLQPVVPEWIEFVDVATHGYVRAHVRNQGQTLTLDFVAAQDRSVRDTVTIKSKFPHAKATAPSVRLGQEEQLPQLISLA